MCEENACTMNQ